MTRFRFVDEHRNAHGVKQMCDVLGWDRSGYYTWHTNKGTRQQRVDKDEERALQIREIHADSRGAYGGLRITRALRVQGYVMNRKRVARVMRERQIAGMTRRKSRSLTKPDCTAPLAPDLIQRDFTAPMPGLKLVGDITCLAAALACAAPTDGTWRVVPLIVTQTIDPTAFIAVPRVAFTIPDYLDQVLTTPVDPGPGWWTPPDEYTARS